MPQFWQKDQHSWEKKTPARKWTLLRNNCAGVVSENRGHRWGKRGERGRRRGRTGSEKRGKKWQEKSGVAGGRWHGWRGVKLRGREWESKQGCQEESVKLKRQAFALYLLILFPGHFPWGKPLKYLMKSGAQVHGVGSIFARSLGSRQCQSSPENICFFASSL